MAEAFAIIGLTSALVQFLDFGSKVVRQLRRLEGELEDIPLVFRNVRSRLPLMLDVVRKLMLQMDAGLVRHESQETMLPVVRNCVSQAEQLDNLISKALPQKNESTWSRGKKAVFGVLMEPEIERIDAALKVNFDLLAQSGTFRLASNFDASKSGVSMLNMSGPTVNLTLLQNEHQSLQHHLPAYSEANPPCNGPVFMVPFQRDANFLGRVAALELIEQRFERHSAVALSGLGGLGTANRFRIDSKSQIAIEYSYIFREKHPGSHVFWVWGSNPMRFEESYQQIARKLSIHGWDDHKRDILQLVYEQLNTEELGKWLLILDNADDAFMYYGAKSGDSGYVRDNAKSYARYLPNNPKGLVLVTTRDRRVGERLSGRQPPIDVTSMTAQESSELLRSKISEPNWCEDDAAKLVAELSFLPLAITQAAAFISENNLTVSEYLETLASGDDDLTELLSEHLEDPRRDLDTENSVMRTWKLSFEQLANGCPRAAEILSLMSVLDWHSVPLLLLRKEKETETGLRTALGALQAFSLVTAGRGKDASCKMHRLVALSTQKWLQMRGSLGYWQSEALLVLSKIFPGPGQQRHAQWATYEALTPHAALIFSYTFSTTDDLLRCAKLLIAVALYSLSRGRYSDAFEMCSKSLEIRQGLLPHDDPAFLDSVQTLGEALLHRGELISARNMLQKAVSGREKALGPEHADTLESLSDLTITLLELDDLSSAEETCMKALNGRMQVLGEDDADTLVSLNILAILQHRQGDLATARRQGELDAASQAIDTVLAGEEKELGAEGYDIQVSLSNKALVCAAQGDFAEASGVLFRVLEMREKQLGPRHPSTAFTMKMITDIHEQNGERETAERFHAMRKGTEKPGALLQAGLLFD
ncbi:hypothetical protein ACCO45_007884 [Purpureocillium lilacinum]|uniref:Uncharacterized protein n=1 Tax=Purpureocillium lilacinum TaxID=33203 RepID=A0ACC4DM26_PURLI